MNTFSESDQNAVRRTALAVGECPSGETPADRTPEARAEIEETRRLAEALRETLRREPVPFVSGAAIAARAMGETSSATTGRRRMGLGGSMRRVEPEAGRGVWIGVAAAACVALAVVSLNVGRPEPLTTVAQAPTKVSSGDGSVMVSLPSSPRATVGSLLAGMPGLPEAGDVFRPAGRASLALSAPRAREYAELLRKEYEAGREPAQSRLRVDALVNAFVAGRAFPLPGGRGVAVETALTEAPWDSSRRLLRVTVRGCGRAGDPVASHVSASLDFSPETVKGWRLIGHEGGRESATILSLRGGDAVTTLFEIEPKGGAKTDWVASVSLRYSVGSRRETISPVVANADFKSLAESDADTRFVAGLAHFAKDRDKAERLAALAGDDADRLAFARAVASRR